MPSLPLGDKELKGQEKMNEVKDNHLQAAICNQSINQSINQSGRIIDLIPQGNRDYESTSNFHHRLRSEIPKNRQKLPDQ